MKRCIGLIGGANACVCIALFGCYTGEEWEDGSYSPYETADSVDATIGEDLVADGEAGDLGELEQPLKNGTVTAVKPGIGIITFGPGRCTASLISPRHAVTAAHCNLHSDTFFAGTNSFTAGGVTRNLSRIFIIGAEEPPGGAVPPGNLDFNPDVAIVELSSAIPAANAAPLFVAAGPPAAGTQVTIYGFGPSGSGCSTAFGTKRFYTFNFGDLTTQFCPGDSGGPGTYFANTSVGAIWGVASFISGSGDVWGNVSRYKEDILSVIRMWDANSAAGLNGPEVGFRRNGTIISTHTGTSASSCRSLCNATASCNSFRHTTSTNTCHLQRDAGDWVSDPDATSGLSSTNRFEVNIDRPGFDYANYITSRAQCSLDCSEESRCAAFSWVSSQSRCFLKEYLGLPVAATGIDSGTKRNFEYYTDRPGSDIADFDLAVSDVRECQSACTLNSSCLAYTYRAPTFPPAIVAEAHCWLKSSAPIPVTAVVDPPAADNKRLISGLWKSTP